MKPPPEAKTPSPGQIVESAQQWALKDWKRECAKLLPDQILHILPLAGPEVDPRGWREKLHAIIANLSSREHLEAMGLALSLEQITEILMSSKEDLRGRIPPLFVGLPQAVFHRLIEQAPQEAVRKLQKEAETEAVQHHLSQLSHELKNRFDAFGNRVASEEKRLAAIDVEQLGTKDVSNLERSIEAVYGEGMEILHLAGQALALAWNANRPDLIQELSRIRELCQRCLHEDVGAPDQTPAVGLWKVLEDRLNSAFCGSDSQGNPILMKKTDPAMEALVKFSIWYLPDYYAIGLLPQIKSKEELEDKNRRQELLSTVESNLAKIGLKTLQDLKNGKVYSKTALIEYIKARM